jgi:kynurenine formamidase
MAEPNPGRRPLPSPRTRAPAALLVALAALAGPAAGTPAGLPFAVHHHMLTQMGIHHLENVRTAEAAADRVWTSCTMILPLRTAGASGSAIRPVAIGVPGQR